MVKNKGCGPPASFINNPKCKTANRGIYVNVLPELCSCAWPERDILTSLHHICYMRPQIPQALPARLQDFGKSSGFYAQARRCNAEGRRLCFPQCAYRAYHGRCGCVCRGKRHQGSSDCRPYNNFLHIQRRLQLLAIAKNFCRIGRRNLRFDAVRGLPSS